jgi:drug/metabolite transporter (DMT)-like permease
MKQNHFTAAIAMILLCGLLLTSMDAATKYLGGFVSVVPLLWIRYTIQAVLMAAWVWRTRGPQGFHTAHPRFQALRGILLLAFSVLVFFSLRYMPLGEFTAIIMLSPVLVTVGSGWLLHEPVGRLRWALLFGGFIGTLIVIRPGSGVFGVAALLPMVSTLILVAYSLLTSRMAVLENPYTTQFYTGIAGCLLLAPLVALQADTVLDMLRTLAPAHFALLVLIGVLSAFAHLLLAMAFSRARPAALMPFTYMQIGFAAIISWLLFHHVPDFWAWVGMIMIAACGAATAWLNMRAVRRA